MKMIDILGGMRLAISEEEYLILEQVKQEKKLYKRTLEERNQTLANYLVTRGVLVRYKDKKGVYYSYNDLQDLWRN